MVYGEAACACGQVFLAEQGASSCAACVAAEQAADRLTCRECGTRMLVAVPKRTCGLCSGVEWDPVRDYVKGSVAA